MSIQHSLWGDERSSIKKWEVGDYLLFKVADSIKSIVRVTNQSFEDDLLIWNNGYYRYRIAFQVVKEFDDIKGKSLCNEFKKHMIAKYGNKYGWVILNKQPLEEEIAELILKY